MKSNRRDRLPDAAVAQEEMGIIQLMFASGDRSAVRLVISNNGSTASLRVAQVSQANLFELGPTPCQWTRYPRAVVHGIQKNLFKTQVLLPLVIDGAILLGLAGRGRALMVLLAVPAYYLCVQSALSTEYRYILAIHYFLFVLAAATFMVISVAAMQMVRWLLAKNRAANWEAVADPQQIDMPSAASGR